MNKINLVVFGASDIAFRRFVPALLKDERFRYVGVAYERIDDTEKAKKFKEVFGGEIFKSYEEVLHNHDVDAIYVPQPPALHYEFGKRVLTAGKNLFMEKPFTTSLKDTNELIELAKSKHLAVVENYMFKFHKQISKFSSLIDVEKIVGPVQKIDIRFSFPRRQKNDFRYNKVLGGGALFDCGGYTIMLSNLLLRNKGKIIDFHSIYNPDFDVDIGGYGIMTDGEKECHFSFGMDNPYCCYAKAYGTKGTLIANRILTAPFDYDVDFELFDISGEKIKIINLGTDDAFLKSINNFYNTIIDESIRNNNYCDIVSQAAFVEKALFLGGIKK